MVANLPHQPVEPIAPRLIVAQNTSINAENLIHSDDTAHEYGFEGGLVAGSAVYGMLTHPLIERYGEAWLTCSTGTVRLIKPVYDQQSITIETKWEPESGYVITALNDNQEVVALLNSQLLSEAPLPAEHAPFEAPLPPANAQRPQLNWETLPSNHILWQMTQTVTAEENATWCASISDNQPLYETQWVHPGLLVQLANNVFKEQYLLPPWIHTKSHIVHHHGLQIDAPLSVRALILQTFAKKQRGFVELYVVIEQNNQLCSEIWHTAIVKFMDRA